MIICNGNKIHFLDYDVIRHWNHLNVPYTVYLNKRFSFYISYMNVLVKHLVPEMRIWSTLLIKSDLKLCIHLSRSLLHLNEHLIAKRKRRRSDPVLWQNPLYQQKIRKPKDNTQTPPKTSITQRLRTDLGRSVGVLSHPTGVVKPVYMYPTFPINATVV